MTIGNTATIGRSPANDASFPESLQISRQHAILRCHNGEEYQIMDLGSRNGTFVDGNRVVFPVTLHENAIIRVGEHEMLFRTLPTPRYLTTDQATIAAATHYGPEREVAILVCDIRGFSGLSEQLPAAVMAKFLGSWFREAGALVQQSNGIIDKFIGDALLAYWSDTPGGNVACDHAFAVSEQLLATAATFAWPVSGQSFKIAIALHHGFVSHGNIGLVAQRDATIIGDAVNTAFRLEGIMKTLGLDVAASADFQQRISSRERFQDMGEMELKGKSLTVRVYGLRGCLKIEEERVHSERYLPRTSCPLDRSEAPDRMSGGNSR